MPQSKGTRPPAAGGEQCGAGLAGDHAVNDLIGYSMGFGKRRRRGTIRAVDARTITIEDEQTKDIVTLRPGARGKVWKLDAATLFKRDARPPLRRSSLRRAPRHTTSPLDSFLADLFGNAGTVPAADHVQPPAMPVLHVVYDGQAPLHPVPKDLPILRCKSYLIYVGTFLCLNAEIEVPTGHSGRTDPHHEGEEVRGYGQKCSDLGYPVPLCRYCHRFYEATNHLPERTQEESLRMMEAAQVRLVLPFLQRVFLALCPDSLRGGTVVDTPEEALYGACLDLPSEEERSYLREVADAS